MDISARTDYAVRALLLLAEAQGRDPMALTSAESLAGQAGLPQKFLEAILTELRRGGLTTSVRGPAGGWRLAKPAAEVSIGSVFRAVDGPLAEVRGLRPHETHYAGAAQHLPELWIAVRAALRHVLDEVTLDQVVSGELPAHVRDLLAQPDAWQAR